jgi:ribonuclease HII
MKYIAGFDEVGRCKLYGNIITATIIVEEDFFEKTKVEIKDSKKLTDKQIKEIFSKTKKNVMFFIGNITPEEIEEENINLLQMKQIVGAVKLFNTIGKIKTFYINNFEVNEGVFFKRFKQLSDDIPDYINLSHKSKDKAIYLASIYARYYELLENDKIRKEYLNIGSGSPSDKKTVKFCLANKDNKIVRKRYLNNLEK